MRNLQDHHIVFRSAGGSNDLENRVALCAFHHLRGLHGGTIRYTGRAPDGLRFDLGVREGGSAVAVYESGERLVLGCRMAKSQHSLSGTSELDD